MRAAASEMASTNRVATKSATANAMSLPAKLGEAVRRGPDIAEQAGIEQRPQTTRKGAGTDLRALEALGRAIGRGLSGGRVAIVDGVVVGDARTMRLVPTLTGSGPLASAYLATLFEAGALSLGHRTDQDRTDWRTPRRCLVCGTVFEPKRRAQAWCSPKCRWTASKTDITNPYLETTDG